MKTITLSLLLVLLSLPVFGEEGVNPYAAIVQRNMFNLKPIPVADTNQTDITPPQTTIVLNGLTKIFSLPQALCQVTTSSNKISYIFDLGETKDGITCAAINFTNETVTFINQGVTQTIGFVAAKEEPIVAPATPAPSDVVPANLMPPGVNVTPVAPVPTPQQVLQSNTGRTPQAMSEARKLLEMYNQHQPSDNQ